MSDFALVEFYGLDSDRPEFWSDLPSNHQQHHHQQLPSPTSSIESPMVSSPVAAVAVETTNVIIVPTLPLSDPLGLVPIKFRQPVAARGKGKRRKDGAASAAESLVSPSFDPKRFLLAHHRSTSYADLRRGLCTLEKAVQSRTETLKGLVKENFDRFVSAKSTVDQVYRELKSKNLNSAGYGTDQFTHALGETFQQANQLFQPIIQRKQKADKIRSTLAILDRYKFFFNLPRSLEESMKKGNYDQAVRDYRKGKSIMVGALAESPAANQSPTTGQVFSLPTAAAAATEQLLTPTQNGLASARRSAGLQKCFEKVWTEVERTVGRLRSALFKELGQLQQQRLSQQRVAVNNEHQERLVSFLVELDSPEDPVWFLVCSQHKSILNNFRIAYNEWSAQMEILCQQHAANQRSEEKSSELAGDGLERLQRQIKAIRFKNEVEALFSEDYYALFNSDLECQAWVAAESLVETASQLLSQPVVDFWKLCLSYRDGKFSSNLLGNNGGNAAKLTSPVAVESSGMRSIGRGKKQQDHSQNNNNQQQQQQQNHGPPTAFANNIDKITQMFTQLIESFRFCICNSLRFLLQSFAEGDRLLDGLKSLPMADDPISRSMFSISAAVPEASEPNTILVGATDQSALDSQLFNDMLGQHMISACQFMPRLLWRIAAAGSDFSRAVTSLSVGGDGGNSAIVRSVSQMIEVIQSIAIEKLLECWTRESGRFYRHEDWRLAGDTSLATVVFSKFQKSTLRTLFMLSNFTYLDLNKLQTENEILFQRKLFISAPIAQEISKHFFDSCYALLDGWNYLTFDNSAWYNCSMVEVNSAIIGFASDGCLDPSQLSNRLLLMLTNVEYAKSILFPDTVMLLEHLFNLQTVSDCEKLMETIGRLERSMFEAFIERKSIILTDICRRGILINGFDWVCRELPAGVQGYVNEMLLQLVLTQAEVDAIIPAQKHNRKLVNRVMGALLKVIMLAVLDCLRQIDWFGGGGSVQARLDVSALMSALDSYLSDSAECEALGRLCLRHIEENTTTTTTTTTTMKTADNEDYSRSTDVGDGEITAMVARWRKASQMQFLSLQLKA